MRKFMYIITLAILVVACSKDKAPEVADNEFEIRLNTDGNQGHYIYSLELWKGGLFTDELMLDMDMNGAEGSLLVNGKEYSEPIAVSAGEVEIAYLPYSSGDHHIDITVTGGALYKSAEFNITGVTALVSNAVFVPYKTDGFDVGLGNVSLWVKDASYFKVNSDYNYQLDWVAQGNGYVYTTIDGVVTGAEVSADKYIELEGLIVEVNGVVCNSAEGITEVKSNIDEDDGSFNFYDYEQVKIIGLYPENATYQNPILTGKWYMTSMPFFPVDNAYYKDVVNTLYVTYDFWGSMLEVGGGFGVVITLTTPEVTKDLYICRFID